MNHVISVTLLRRFITRCEAVLVSVQTRVPARCFLFYAGILSLLSPDDSAVPPHHENSCMY